jgi:general secretion pathway protein A
MQQVAQRVSVDYHLGCLDADESREYVVYRITRAGGDATLFDEGALGAIHEYTRGTPRLINVLCDTALVCGYAEHKERIDAELVSTVARDKRAGGILPLPDAAHGRCAPEAETIPPPVPVSPAIGTPQTPEDVGGDLPGAEPPAMTPDQFRLLFGNRGRNRG